MTISYIVLLVVHRDAKHAENTKNTNDGENTKNANDAVNTKIVFLPDVPGRFRKSAFGTHPVTRDVETTSSVHKLPHAAAHSIAHQPAPLAFVYPHPAEVVPWHSTPRRSMDVEGQPRRSPTIAGSN